MFMSSQCFQVLRHKFSLFTGTHRPLNESDLGYLAEKLIIPSGGPELKPITFHRFAKVINFAEFSSSVKPLIGIKE
jgi:hypothetical protein